MKRPCISFVLLAMSTTVGALDIRLLNPTTPGKHGDEQTLILEGSFNSAPCNWFGYIAGATDVGNAYLSTPGAVGDRMWTFARGYTTRDETVPYPPNWLKWTCNSSELRDYMNRRYIGQTQQSTWQSTAFSACGKVFASGTCFVYALPHGYGSFIFEGNAILGPPQPTVTCNARKTGDIAFGNITEKDLNGAKASTTLTISCNEDARVKIRFVDAFDKAVTAFRPDISGSLTVGGWPGNIGYTGPVKKGIPDLTTLNVVLSPVGAVSPGEFRGTLVVKVEVL